MSTMIDKKKYSGLADKIVGMLNQSRSQNQKNHSSRQCKQQTN